MRIVCFLNIKLLPIPVRYRKIDGLMRILILFSDVFRIKTYYRYRKIDGVMRILIIFAIFVLKLAKDSGLY
jgi:hypothetical protein